MRTMPQATAGTAPVKSLSQIIAENDATVIFYRNVTMAVGAFYNIFYFFFFHDHMRPFIMCMNILVMVIYITCHQLMRFISRPRYSSEFYSLIEPGVDLNSPGLGEHLKDIVIISTIAQLLALFSDMFWLTLFVIPLKGLWLIWVNIFSPWLFGPKDDEDDKKFERNRFA